MKKNISIIALVLVVVALVIALVNEKRDDAVVTTTEITTTETTTIEETTTETTSAEETMTEETTEEISEKETQIYENLELFKEIKILSKELPFVVSGGQSIENVKLYIPREPIGDEDVWENTYITIECLGDSENIAIKFDPVNGIQTGNIIPKNEMIHANTTYIYLDGKYSQEYTLDKDGEMLIFKDFSEGINKIKISNRSANPIFEGKIDGEDVVVNDIIIQFK